MSDEDEIAGNGDDPEAATDKEIELLASMEKADAKAAEARIDQLKDFREGARGRARGAQDRGLTVDQWLAEMHEQYPPHEIDAFEDILRQVWTGAPDEDKDEHDE